YLYDGSILTGHYNGYIKQWNLNKNELKFIVEKKFMMSVISQLKNVLKDSFFHFSFYTSRSNFVSLPTVMGICTSYRPQ
ncbi:MAG: hypothetical protein IKM77_14040, partial [Prevotella sp.]|nr:hypothetical protein [Prevotella sp.]